jgi:hypothetical protein
MYYNLLYLSRFQLPDKDFKAFPYQMIKPHTQLAMLDA